MGVGILIGRACWRSEGYRSQGKGHWRGVQSKKPRRAGLFVSQTELALPRGLEPLF